MGGSESCRPRDWILLVQGAVWAQEFLKAPLGILICSPGGEPLLRPVASCNSQGNKYLKGGEVSQASLGNSWDWTQMFGTLGLAFPSTLCYQHSTRCVESNLEHTLQTSASVYIICFLIVPLHLNSLSFLIYKRGVIIPLLPHLRLSLRIE